VHQLKVRYLKFQPKNWHVCKSMRVAVYGPCLSAAEKERKKGTEVVRYTLTMPRDKRYFHQKHTPKGCKCSYCFPVGEGNKKRAAWRQLIKSELSAKS